MNIRELPSEWRKKLSPAYFGNAIFHTEAGGKASGRRLAIHEFPKRNQPYSEDMGRKARRWTVQGYIIVSPLITDYIPARDALIEQLEADGPAYLKLPTMEREYVMCDQYRWEETREKGGIALFDMVFIERGEPIVRDQGSALPRRVLPDVADRFGDAVINFETRWTKVKSGAGQIFAEVFGGTSGGTGQA